MNWRSLAVAILAIRPRATQSSAIGIARPGIAKTHGIWQSRQ
ncbi:hypothetical protein [Shinella zoogloeoides]|nr:hypothetical protein [Shinella zoogloeoides]WLR94361.1 hypothetical protein Q9316_09395 [Shinella zoogloeoides]